MRRLDAHRRVLEDETIGGIDVQPARGFENDAPYAIAVVELPEGVRMMTNIVDCPQTPEALQLDMPLEVVFEKVSETISLPKFRPAKR